MDGSSFETRYPIVLRFEGIGPENLAGYEKHRKREGGDTGHILAHPPAPNRLLIGDEDWAAKALAEITGMKLQNFATELQALEQRKRKKDLESRLAEGPRNPWRPTRHGPMREVILTANKEWFNADPAAVFDEGIDENQRIADFERLAVDWLKEQFGEDVIHARADLDEEAYHIHAVIMPRVLVEMTRKDRKTGEKKVIATRLMLQPSKFDVIENYELAQDSVGEWFSRIGLVRGETRKEAFREAVAKGETPPPKRVHTRTRDWRRKKDVELAQRERDLEARTSAVDERAVAVEEKAADAHTARANKAGRTIQPRRRAGGSVPDADFIASVRLGAGSGAIGEFDKLDPVQLEDIEHQAGAPLRGCRRGFGVFADRKDKQNNVTALDKIFRGEVRHERLGEAKRTGTAARGKPSRQIWASEGGSKVNGHSLHARNIRTISQ